MIDPYRFGAAGGALVDPALMFTGTGDEGGFWDFTDASTLYAETSRTTLASLNGPALGITDKSGNGYHLSGVSTIRRTGYIESATNHSLIQDTKRVGTNAGLTAYIAFQLPSLVGTGIPSDPHIALFGCDRNSQNVAQLMNVLSTGGQLYCVRFYNNSSSTDTFQSANPEIVANINTYCSVELTETEIAMRKNGSVVASPLTTASRSQSNFVPGPIGIGVDWLGTSTVGYRRLPVGSRLYAALFINRQITSQERTDLNAWFANRAGL